MSCRRWNDSSHQRHDDDDDDNSWLRFDTFHSDLNENLSNGRGLQRRRAGIVVLICLLKPLASLSSSTCLGGSVDVSMKN